MDGKRRRQAVAGFVLAGLGIFFYVLQQFGEIGTGAVLLLLGSAFLAAYLYTVRYGLLIPGCILLGMGLGQLGEETVFGQNVSTVVGLGFGFVAIYVVALAYERRSHWWPLIPGGVLILGGLGISTTTIMIFLRRNWPLILIFLGAAIVISALLGGRTRRSAG